MIFPTCSNSSCINLFYILHFFIFYFRLGKNFFYDIQSEDSHLQLISSALSSCGKIPLASFGWHMSDVIYRCSSTPHETFQNCVQKISVPKHMTLSRSSSESAWPSSNYQCFLICDLIHSWYFQQPPEFWTLKLSSASQTNGQSFVYTYISIHMSPPSVC